MAAQQRTHRWRLLATSSLLATVWVSLLWAAPVAQETAASPYESALALYREGRIDRAQALLQAEVDGGRARAGEHALLGWCGLRQGEVERAAVAFAAAALAAPESADPVTGQGFVALRRGQSQQAQRHFSRATTLDPNYSEAWKGLGLAQTQLGDLVAARQALQRAVELAPGDLEAREFLNANLALIVEERRPRGAVAADQPLRIAARARAARFEVPGEHGFVPLFVKGVNLGTALPGKFPAEFPDDPALYREWFDLMGEAGFNVLRLYTLHPPSLYRALHEHNLARPAQKLWLVHGVWTELPPAHNFDDADFDAEFRAEIRRVIDALHGNLELPARPGHADGRYEADLSGDLLALALGREWEPFSVDAYNRKHAGKPTFIGEYVRVDPVYPIESWLASICETAIEHSTRQYRTQYPVGFTSWPTLDPLIHPTEATVDEETELRKARGETDVEEIKEYENDLVQLDSTRFSATEHYAAGLFAVYHAYPYYPEFMMLEPEYGAVSDDEGVSRYLGYLQALRRHHGEQPVLIGEFGVPNSRGIAHLHPEGQHHGGQNTLQQGAINARLMRNIDAAGLAGGAVFAWIDEWFKRNWLVMNYESPPERNPLWLNALDAEQNYGLLGAYPGADGWKIVIDGRGDDWDTIAPLYTGNAALRMLRVTSDEAYLYLALNVEPGSNRFWIGLDTYDAQRGSHRFSRDVERRSAVGFEFLLQFAGPDESKILVDRGYDLFSNRLRRPYQSNPNDDGDFVEIVTYTNRDRFARDGTYYPPKGYSRSPLRRGSMDPNSADFDDLADWATNATGSLIEARIPWGLINIADPSSHRVIHEETETEGVVQTTRTEGFRFHVLALDSRDRQVDAFPTEDRLANYPIYHWDGWQQPSYRLELKPSYFAMKAALASIPAQPLRSVRQKKEPRP